MTTFLQLVKDLRRECTDSGTGPVNVTGNTGELERFVNWTKQAYVELQQDREDWLWLRKSFYVDTVASDGAYVYTDCTDSVTLAAISRFSRWYQNYFQCYLSSAGVSSEYSLLWMDWEEFRYIYRRGTQTNGRPVNVSVDPTMAFVLGPKPDAVYRVSGDYQKGPQVLAADDDEPEMPSRFHALVTYESMSKYGGSRVAPEAILRANAEGTKLRNALELDQLPKLRMWNPMT